MVRALRRDLLTESLLFLIVIAVADLLGSTRIVDVRYPESSLVSGPVAVRPWSLQDLAFLAGASAKEADPWSPMPIGFSEQRWKKRLTESDQCGELTFMIEHDSQRAGIITLGGFDHVHRVAEISGYWIKPELRGYSIAPAAISVVTQWAIESLACARVQIFTRPDNASSRRAAWKAGFAEEGVLRSFVEVAGERSDAVVLSRINVC